MRPRSIIRALLSAGTHQLQPLEQIERNPPDSPFDWKATGTDPQFVLSLRLGLSGWYMLEARIRHQWTQLSARLYVDLGDGLREHTSISLPLPSGRLSKRLFYLERRPRLIRFDPFDRPGHFSIDHFRLVWLPPFFAKQRMLRRIARYQRPHQAQAHPAPERRLARELKQQARVSGRQWLGLALEHYGETFAEHHLPGRQAPRVYQDWLAHAEQGRPTQARVQTITAKLRHQPLISIILPTFNARTDWLSACIDSVQRQGYPHWQLCIADDGSSEEAPKRLLAARAAKDGRFSLRFRKRNGGIAAASNSALELVQGAWAAFLDQDDCLADDALFQLARAINRHPAAQLIYSDEDKLDADGNRDEPHFKADWNPDLALAQNYVNHLAAYRTSLIRAVGGLRADVDGSQDHDLLLRATAALRPNQIIHVPRVLYHWRAAEGSVAQDPSHKPDTGAAGLRSVREFLGNKAPGATVMPGPIPNSYRIRWPIPTPAPLVSILVPTRDGAELLAPCANAILNKTDYPAIELLIIDNDSRCRDTLALMRRLAQDRRVRVIKAPGEFNFSALINAGAAAAVGDLLLLLNNDTLPIDADWLRELVAPALRPEIGCVGAKLLYRDGRVQHAGVILGIGGVAGHAHKYFPGSANGYFGRLQLAHNLSAVTAACLMVRRAIFSAVGGFDSEQLPVSFNDVDFCLRVQAAGFRNHWTPHAVLYHLESASRGAEDSPQKRARFADELNWMRRRWGRQLQRDPAYNPNLTLQHEDFSLR